MENNFRKNTIWNTLGLTFNAFSSLFLLIIINRINGIDGAGIFSFSFSIACLFYIIGIYSGRTFQVSDTQRDLNDREYLIHKFMTCTIMLVITILFIFIQQYSVEKSLIIFVLCFYKNLEAFSDTFYGYLQKNNQLYVVGKSLFYKSVFGIFVFFIVDLLTKNVLLSCLSLLLTSFIYVILYDVRKTSKIISKEQINIKKIFRFFKIGFSVFVFSFFAVYIVNVPKYVLDVFLEAKFQTIFNIIIMPGTVVSLCGQYIMHPLLTELVNTYNEKNYISFKQLVVKICKILIIISIVIEICAYLFGIPILSSIYQLDLKDYRWDLIIIIFGAFLYALAGVVSTALITMRKNNMQLLIYFFDAVFGTITCFLLIKGLGIHGATYAYFLTMLLHVILYFVYFEYEYIKLTRLNT